MSRKPTSSTFRCWTAADNGVATVNTHDQSRGGLSFMRDNLAASTDHVERAAAKTDVGLFVRSLVGVDMTDANDEFAGFSDVGG